MSCSSRTRRVAVCQGPAPHCCQVDSICSGGSNAGLRVLRADTTRQPRLERNEQPRNRHAGRVELSSQWDLHPEWGYLAPGPGFIRTVRAVALATVFGAIVGGSLIAWISHSATETSVAARTLVTAPIDTRPARSTSQDHVVHAINPPPQSAPHQAKILRAMKPRRN